MFRAPPITFDHNEERNKANVETGPAARNSPFLMSEILTKLECSDDYYSNPVKKTAFERIYRQNEKLKFGVEIYEKKKRRTNIILVLEQKEEHAITKDERPANEFPAITFCRKW